MLGLVWIIAIWSLALAVLYWLHGRNGRDWQLSPLLVRAIVLVLLATESAGSGIGDTSIGLATIVRGGLASAALVFAVRVLLVNSVFGRVRSQRRTNLILLSVYAGFAAFTTLYSVAPIQTAGKAYELGVGVIIIWAIATSANARVQLKAAIDLIVVLWSSMLVAAMVGFFVMPSEFTVADTRPGFVFDSAMGAPYAHSNGLSAIGATVAAYALARGFTCEAARGRRAWHALAVLASMAIVLASGRQGVAIWAVSVGIVLFVAARPLFVFFVTPCFVVGVYYWGARLWQALSRDQYESTLVTLTGRLDFWRGAIDVWYESPLLGYGFGVGGRFVALPGIGADDVSSLHSGYFEALVGVGLLGLIPLLTVAYRVARWSVPRIVTGVQLPLAILIVPLAMHTAVSLGFGGWLSSQFIVLSLLAAYVDIDETSARSSRGTGARRTRGDRSTAARPWSHGAEVPEFRGRVSGVASTMDVRLAPV